MTLILAWVRKQRTTEELIIASDSRLRSGFAWDACPKLFLTPRGDISFGFAGDTMYAYPLIIQALNQVAFHRASMTREKDVHEEMGHIRRIFHGMLAERSDFPTGEGIAESPETLFVMAGYSWRKRDFSLWKVRYDTPGQAFVWEEGTGLRGAGLYNRLVVVGDPTLSDQQRRKAIRKGQQPRVAREDDVVKIAKERIARRIVQRAAGKRQGGLDMEPFEVLCQMIRDGVSPHVAGAPQMIKMYPSCSSQAFGVLWPDRKSATVTFLGRPLLNYERLECPLIDPETMEIGKELWPKLRRKTETL
jgi:hypothetical protein